MAPTRCIPTVLLAALACAAHAQPQSQSQYAPSRPSTVSRPSAPTVEFDEAGNPRNGSTGSGGTAAIGADASATGTPAPTGARPNTRPNTRATTTQMLGAGAFGQSDGLENAVNSGTPPSWDRKGGVRKVCPPELENRNNVCVPPLGSILSR